MAVLTPDVLEKIKKELQKAYTDEEIDAAAYFMVAPVLVTAEQIGIADGGDMARAVCTNFFAGALISEHINRGLIDPTRILEWMKEVAELVMSQSRAAEALDEEGRRANIRQASTGGPDFT